MRKTSKSVWGTIGYWIVCIVPTVIYISLSLFSCQSILTSCDTKTKQKYDDSYYEGFEVGYYEGIAEAQHFLAFVIDDDLSNIARAIEDEYGMHPEDALMILSNYVDVPDEVNQEDIPKAIWVIYSYYNKSNELINSIEDYAID